MSTGGWADLALSLPSVLSEEDRDQLIQTVLADLPASQQCLVMAGSVLVSQGLVNGVIGTMEEEMGPAAKRDVESGRYAQTLVDGRGAGGRELQEEERLDKKEERRKKAAGGKAGGGAQGRETKTKAVKKKGGKRRDDDWEDEERGGAEKRAAGKGGRGGGRI